ncbi:unnamed protein product [Ilex paraguariensis]|uniref:Hexosyltransferase n=1 Tax=Ilex paraguariensis TaxID=185542 RepID=A0ABC8U053_9AQUA
MGWWREKTKRLGLLIFVCLVLAVVAVEATSFRGGELRGERLHRNAYATMMYMGTPRDYEFYVAIRVMLRSLSKFAVEADLVVIASLDVPLRWVQALPFDFPGSFAILRLSGACSWDHRSGTIGDRQSPMVKPLLFVAQRQREQEDGARVVRVENLKNPYRDQNNFDSRFKLTLNKLYAWSLVDYDRVVMLDADNLFLQKTDELFQCGQFCAVFINPCVFHTGLLYCR